MSPCTGHRINLKFFRHGKDAIEEGQRLENSMSSSPADQHSDLDESVPVTMSPGLNPWDKAFLPRKWYHFDARLVRKLFNTWEQHIKNT